MDRIRSRCLRAASLHTFSEIMTSFDDPRFIVELVLAVVLLALLILVDSRLLLQEPLIVFLPLATVEIVPNEADGTMAKVSSRSEVRRS